MDAFRIVGRISGLFSGDGELNVATYGDFPSGEDFEEPLFVFIDKLAVPLFIASLRRRSGAAAIVRFEDVETQAIASTLVGLELFVAAEAGQKGGRKTGSGFERLVGYRALLDQTLQGEVAAFLENGANPLLEITVGGKELYVPAVAEFILHVDHKCRSISLALPEGLAELYLT